MPNPRGWIRVAALGLAAALVVGCESGPIGPEETLYPSGPAFTFTGRAQGCTPGYWKQAHHFDSWQVYSPTDSFNAVFGVGTEWFPNSYTLLDALKQGGGGLSAYLRHGVAALLNSVSDDVNYHFHTEDIIANVQANYPEDGSEDLHEIWEDLNESGCPLN